MSDLYQAIIIEEASHPQNKGTLPVVDTQYEHTNASCGDDVTVQLKLSQDRTTIESVAWQGSGCAISQAAMSFLSEEIKGKTLKDILSLQQHDLEELLGLEQITPGRTKCLMLGLNAVRKAIERYQEAR